MIALALLLLVPGEAPPPVLTGPWLSAVRGTDDFDVTIVRDADGRLVTRWFDLETGACRYKGVLTLEADGRWREVYDPEYSRCGDWLWTLDSSGVLVDQHSAWRLRRPSDRPPDL